ncbi:hypothetical protein ACQ4PT_053765 [Festuca glaucescens]
MVCSNPHIGLSPPIPSCIHSRPNPSCLLVSLSHAPPAPPCLTSTSSALRTTGHYPPCFAVASLDLGGGRRPPTRFSVLQLMSPPLVRYAAMVGLSDSLSNLDGDSSSREAAEGGPLRLKKSNTTQCISGATYVWSYAIDWFSCDAPQQAASTMAYTFRIHCRASDDYSLAIVDGDVILTKADPSDDRTVDEAGNPAFALVNKATGDALKHSFGYCLPFDPGYLDESVLWAEKVLPDGFRIIHMVNNMDYLFDAEEAIPQYGGVRDGTRLILFRWNSGKNQMWQFTPNTPDQAPPLRILFQSIQELSLAVRDGTALLARTEHEDDTQVQVVGYSPDSVDVALLWTLSDDLGEGFHCIRSASHVSFVLDAAEGRA